VNREKLVAFFKQYPALVIALAALPYLVVKALNGGDFNTYLAAAQKLREGANCYNIWLQYGNSKVPLQYGYSPLFAALLIPFTYLPVWLPQLLFLIAGVFCITRVLKLLMQLLDIHEPRLQLWWLALVLLFSLRFILHNLEMVQLNIFLLWLSVEGLYQIFYRERKLAGALLLALGINFKLLPLVFVPYLIYRRQWKAFGVVSALAVFFLFLPVLFFGFEMNAQLHRDWWSIINPLNDKYNAGQNADSYRIHGLAALFASYFSKNSEGHFQVLIAEVSNATLQWLINGARLVLVLFSFFFLRTLTFREANNRKQFVAEVAYLLLVTPLIFPQQNKWAFVYLLPAFAYIFYTLLQDKQWRSRPVELTLLAVVFGLTTLTTDGIVGKQLNYYTECLKLVTIGTLALVPVLAISYNRKTEG
jgi:hypothetical protein